MHNIDVQKQKDNPLQYDIHPLDFIKKKTIIDLENTLENGAKTSTIGFSSSGKNHTDTLDEAYGGSADQHKSLDEFRRDFFDNSFPG